MVALSGGFFACGAQRLPAVFQGGEVRNCHAYGMVIFVQSARADTLRVRCVIYW
jgi:hypothetical protein